MKIWIISFSLAFMFMNTSCAKEYVCVCTHTATGEVSRGDVIKTGPIRKPQFEKTCKNTADLSLGTLKDCHLE